MGSSRGVLRTWFRERREFLDCLSDYQLLDNDFPLWYDLIKSYYGTHTADTSQLKRRVAIVSNLA
jgi:hypothetical protein